VTDSGMNPSRPPRSFLGPVLGALHSIVIVVTHTAVGATILVSIWSLEQLIHLLWGDREPMIFNTGAASHGDPNGGRGRSRSVHRLGNILGDRGLQGVRECL
jgi:hypothetical protein